LSMLSFSLTCLCSIFFIWRRKPDFIIVESPPLTLGFSGWILSGLSRSRLILNISDLWPLSAKELGAINDGIAYRMLERLERFLYRQAELSMGQSQEIVDHIRRLSMTDVYLFRNGVDTRRFEGVEPEPSKRNQIVYAGLLGVAQGILAICENINFREQGAEFHIYGSGVESEKLV